MAIQINLNQPPFSFLEPKQLDWLIERLDLVFFPANSTILNAGDVSPGMFVIYNGVVEEVNQAGTKVYSRYATEDIFDVSAILESRSKHKYVAPEETLLYRLLIKVIIY